MDEHEHAGDLSETPFRIYRLDATGYRTGAPKCLGGADDVSLGEALLDLHRQGKRIDGILYRPVDGEPGEWLINPFGQPFSVSGRLDRATTESTEGGAP
jgi:hypothetical protein